jgi:hypothetical protein
MWSNLQGCNVQINRGQVLLSKFTFGNYIEFIDIGFFFGRVEL